MKLEIRNNTFSLPVSLYNLSSHKIHNLFFLLFLFGIMAYGGLFVWYMVDRFELVNLIRDFNNDDAFYYFQIAKNFAAGEFSSFDGGITRTNGYHPLWALAITPIFWIFDSETALFAIKVFEIILIAGSASLILIAARICRLPWILLIAVLPHLYRYSGLFRGLEAAIAIFMLGLLFLALSQYAREQTKNSWLLLTVLFLLPWARLEFVAISLTVGVLLYIIETFQHETLNKTSKRKLLRSYSSTGTTMPLFSAVTGAIAYFAYNRIVFGGYIPVSAVIKQARSQSLWGREGGYSLVDNFLEVLQISVFNLELLVVLEIGIYFILVWCLMQRSREHYDRMFLLFLLGVFSLAVGHFAKFAQTVLMIHPKWGAYSWYYAPAYLMMALIVPVRCYVLIYFIRRFVQPKYSNVSNMLIQGIIFCGLAILLVQSNFSRPFDYVNHASEASHREWEVTSYLGTQVINLTLPEDSIVGSWDAGVLGYFSDLPVVNLDGLVNSYGYSHAKIEGNEEQYYQRFGITHFANARPVTRTFNNLLFEGVSFFYTGTRKDLEFKLWSAHPLDQQNNPSQLWSRLMPSLEPVSDNIYIMFHDDFAQIFAKECNTELIEKQILVFSWRANEDGGQKSISYPWKNPRANRLGFCVEGYQLPKDVIYPILVDLVKAAE